jgi:hypothetical protein
MRKRQKIAVTVIATFVGLAVFASLQVGPFLAYRKIHDVDWLLTASHQEQRETAHQALGFWLGDPHDAFISLGYYGDQSSIPYLQKALRFAPSADSELVVCTWKHGRDALARLTSEKQREPVQLPVSATSSNE